MPAVKVLSSNGYYSWEKDIENQLHVLADASEKELCVIAYLRYDSDNINVFFRNGKDMKNTK